MRFTTLTRLRSRGAKALLVREGLKTNTYADIMASFDEVFVASGAFELPAGSFTMQVLSYLGGSNERNLRPCPHGNSIHVFGLVGKPPKAPSHPKLLDMTYLTPSPNPICGWLAPAQETLDWMTSRARGRCRRPNLSFTTASFTRMCLTWRIPRRNWFASENVQAKPAPRKNSFTTGSTAVPSKDFASYDSKEETQWCLVVRVKNFCLCRPNRPQLDVRSWNFPRHVACRSRRHSLDPPRRGVVGVARHRNWPRRQNDRGPLSRTEHVLHLGGLHGASPPQRHRLALDSTRQIRNAPSRWCRKAV